MSAAGCEGAAGAVGKQSHLHPALLPTALPLPSCPPLQEVIATLGDAAGEGEPAAEGKKSAKKDKKKRKAEAVEEAAPAAAAPAAAEGEKKKKKKKKAEA